MKESVRTLYRKLRWRARRAWRFVLALIDLFKEIKNVDRSSLILDEYGRVEYWKQEWFHDKDHGLCKDGDYKRWLRFHVVPFVIHHLSEWALMHAQEYILDDPGQYPVNTIIVRSFPLGRVEIERGVAFYHDSIMLTFFGWKFKLEIGEFVDNLHPVTIRKEVYDEPVRRTAA